MDSLERQSIAERTEGRNQATWVNLDTAGYVQGLVPLENVLNGLGQNTIGQYLAVLDADIDFESEMRGLLFQLELEGIEVEEQIALAKHETQRQVLAMRIAGEQLKLAAQEYDVQVQDLIMTAKEYAAQVEWERIELEKTRAEMAVRKEEARVKEIEARILLEKFEQQKVAVEIARTKLQVAQTNVKVVLAEIGVEEAKLKVIQAELQAATAEAEKASLQADIAQILADIIVRGLTQIRLEVETAEIEAGFRYIQQKLDDVLANWANRTLIEEIRRGHEEALILEAYQQRDIAISAIASNLADMLLVWASRNNMELVKKEVEEAVYLEVKKQIEATLASIQQKLVDMLAIWASKNITEQIRKESEEQIYRETEMQIETTLAGIASKLADMIQVWQSKITIELVRKEVEELIYGEVAKQLAAALALLDTKIDAQEADEEVWNYEKGLMEAYKWQEHSLRQEVFENKIGLTEDKSLGARQITSRGLWAKLLTNAAHKWVYKNRMSIYVTDDHYSQKIIKGFLTGNPSFPATFSTGLGPCGE